jgi:hypothetical protein
MFDWIYDGYMDIYFILVWLSKFLFALFMEILKEKQYLLLIIT